MELIGVIGIIAGLVFFVIAAMKGWNVLITSIVTAIVIALTNGMDIMESMVGTETSYVTGLAGFIRGNLLIFMGGAIMGEFMDKSGAAKAIAQFIMSKVGTKSPYFVLWASPRWALCSPMPASRCSWPCLPSSRWLARCSASATSRGICSAPPGRWALARSPWP